MIKKPEKNIVILSGLSGDVYLVEQIIWMGNAPKCVVNAGD